MNQSSEKAAMLSKISTIHQVDGFDPAVFAVEYTDLSTGERRKRLPVMIQIAWFRLKYPEGRIATHVVPAKNCFVATARIYPSFHDAPECYLAEATAARSPDPTKPSISAREWAQTAAIGIALRNAGFGLQFQSFGDDDAENTIPEFLEPKEVASNDEPACPGFTEKPEAPAKPADPPSEEELLQQAMNTPCPIQKYSGKTLGEVLAMDPKALTWVATKFTGNPEITAAAKRICEYAMQQATA